MKKNLIKSALGIVLALSLLCSLGAVAFADGNTVNYTLKQGDTVGAVCASMGLDFAKYRSWISEYNHIADYSRLAVGQVIVLPANNNVKLADLPAAQAPAANGAAKGAAAASYLISYTLKGGDTIYTVCQQLGIDYTANSERILKLNNIQNVKNLKAGQTLLLPSASAPASGAYLKVISHRVERGEVLIGICRSYEIDYAANQAIIQGLNPTTNLNAIKAGQLLYLPVAAGTDAGAASAASNTSGRAVRFFVNYTLKSGDTLYSVCNALGIDYNANADEILKLNNIQNVKNLKIGQVLLLPLPAAPTSGSYIKVVAYTVAAGDTMTGICKGYGISFDANRARIQMLNPNTNLNAIKVGQTVYIPVPATASASSNSSSTSPTVTPTPSPTPTPTVTKADISKDTVSRYLVSYILKTGDTLSGVCKSYGIDYSKNSAEILRINHISDVSLLTSGHQIYLPVSSAVSGTTHKIMAHTIAAGDTVTGICLAYSLNYNSSLDMIQVLNPGLSVSSLKTGGVIYIPVPFSS